MRLSNKKASATKVDKGIVTFLDVLGWKGLWQSNREAVEQLKQLVEETRNKADKIVSKYNKQENAKSVLHKDIKIKVLSISDTIVFLTEVESIEAIKCHAQLCAWLLEYALSKGFPLRGAISYGEFNESMNIMLGPAIDEAAAWHESTDWIGVILTPSAQMYIRDKENIAYVTDYEHIPFKKGIKTLHKCVDWDFENKEILYDIFLDKGPHMPEVAPKYLNTLEFLNRDKNENKKYSAAFTHGGV